MMYVYITIGIAIYTIIGSFVYTLFYEKSDGPFEQLGTLLAGVLWPLVLLSLIVIAILWLPGNIGKKLANKALGK